MALDNRNKSAEKKTVNIKRKTNAIHADVDDAIEWVKSRNALLQKNGAKGNQACVENLPALGKVIFGGEAGIKLLPEKDRSKYIDYFKKNGSRLALLTTFNPVLGFGTLGAEVAATGLISTKGGIVTTATGAGLLGAAKLAVASFPKSACVSVASKALWYVPGLQYVGAGLFALGAGATLFKAVEKLPQGKKLAELFTETQNLHNDCYIQLEHNIAQVNEILSTQIRNVVEKLEATTKKIAISIDDAVHSDQNLRLMQYSEITLNLCNAQIEIKKELEALTEKYNALMIKNQELSKEIEEYRINMQILACSGEYLK